MIRLLKPLDYYREKYGNPLWGLDRMYLLMEKQRNRGQDGAGLVSLKLNVKPGLPYMHRLRDNNSEPWTRIFKQIDDARLAFQQRFPDFHEEGECLKQHFDFSGEVLMGHLRYGTHSSNGIEAVHPVVRLSEYQNRSLAIAGNFNLTNVDHLFQKLVELGQHPRYQTDTETMLERIGHFLDVANETLARKLKKEGFDGKEKAQQISENLSLVKVMRNAAKAWDGGYVIGGVVGNGDAFVVRDPNGIRPCYYHITDEFVVAASERAAISAIFNAHPRDIPELAPGNILSIKANGDIKIREFTEPGEKLSCSFERIYFSRGNDVDIYRERKALGAYVAPSVLKAVDYDLDHTIFGYIPNTAESAYWGLIKEVEDFLNVQKADWLEALGSNPKREDIDKIINMRMRVEKIILKDVKMRTFIADDNSRDDIASHVYDITRGIVQNDVDNLVLLDDSIVRGTTLRQSILNILARLKPKKIVIVSSAPQIRYPDCYGIDMSQIGKLVAFQAAVALLRERGQEVILEKVYNKIKAMQADGSMAERNMVKEIYAPFTEEDISKKITELLRPANFTPELEIIFQPLENLPKAIPDHRGDWYFSGNYPTPGGIKVVNQAYLNFYEGKNLRAYQASLA